MSKIICMSDIHGCFDVFERRLEQLGGLHSVLHGSNQLILLGDYINYGPESGKVLRRIFSLQQSCPERVIVLRGNHEDALAIWLRQHFGQRSADDRWYNKRSSLAAQVLAALPPALRAPARLTASQKCPCKQAFLLHGITTGLPTKCTSKPFAVF